MTRKVPSKSPLWAAFLFMAFLCLCFYSVLYLCTGGAAQTLASPTRVLLSAGFCLLFCLLLGGLGLRVTGRYWPAPVLHTAVAALLLGRDVPLAALQQDWDIALMLLATVYATTLLGAGGGRLTQRGKAPKHRA